MGFSSTVVAAFVIAAVLIYDRLGGNQELARRLYQIGLAASLVFLVVSSTSAFVLNTEGEISGNLADNLDDRAVVAVAVHYGAGVALLVAGLIAMRTYQTVPLALMLGGILLLLVPGSVGTLQLSAIAGIDARASQQVDIATFIVALVGTGALLWYGSELEKEFTVEEEPEEEDVVEGV